VREVMVKALQFECGPAADRQRIPEKQRLK
jgi:hypothetical protein